MENKEMTATPAEESYIETKIKEWMEQPFSKEKLSEVMECYETGQLTKNQARIALGLDTIWGEEGDEKYIKVGFLCNGERPKCKNEAGCYKNGGDCKGTFNVEYAKNFKHTDNCAWIMEEKGTE